ncbi:MAG: IS1182 family transposase [Sporomusa sp.]
MLERKKDLRNAVEIVCLEELIPQNHLLRKIDSTVDFSKIYGLVEELYCHDNGRPSVDPVVLFKIVLIQHLYGLPSLRQTLRDVETNIAYRWFLGYSLNETVPHFATVSYNFVHRFTGETIQAVFAWILEEAAKVGYLSPETVFIDATHIKASANINKKVKKQIPITARTYEKQLMEEINADRAAHGKKPFDDDDPKGGAYKTKTVTTSTTDPDSGMFRKGEHKHCFAYGAHTACDKNNFILDVEVTPGNTHDSIVFDRIYDKVTNCFPEVETVVMDAGYRTPWICKKVFDDGRLPSLPYKRPMTKKGNHEWYKYVHDEYYDQILCPEYRTLDYSTTNREGYREYKSKPYQCKACPTRERCTQSKASQKIVTQHVWQEYIDRAEDVRHSPHGKQTYALRKQTIERVFADAKEKHGMRYTQHRGLERVSNWVRMKYTAMNLKKLALWMAKHPLSLFRHILSTMLEPQEPCFAS